MSFRILLGSGSMPWADQFLAGCQQAADVLTFDMHTPADIIVPPSESWDSVVARFPGGWTPDAIVVCLPVAALPTSIWNAPWPVVALAAAPQQRWHAYRRMLRHCDLVLASSDVIEAMKREGIDWARSTGDLGPPIDWTELSWPHEAPFATWWKNQIATISSEVSLLRDRASRRQVANVTPDLRTRTWWGTITKSTDASLISDTTRSLQERPRDAHLHNALGVLSLQSGESAATYAEAANAFQEAWRSDPRHVVAGLNLAEVLIALGQPRYADEQGRRVLAVLDEIAVLDADWLDASLCRATPDVLRAEWEQAAWANVGKPEQEARAKVALIRWRLHTLLGQLHDDIVHFFAAWSQQPHLPAGQASLGCGLARKGRFREAVVYLSEAVKNAPLDLDAARALYETLGRIGLTAQQQMLTTERRLLAESSPQAVPIEPWFADQAVPPRAPDTKATSRLRIVWHGSQQALHSLAGVNREICHRLVRRGHEVSLMPARYDDPPGTRVPLPADLQGAWIKGLSGAADIHVGHQWPPDFIAPQEGHWIIMQPWEYGSAPRAWVEPMTALVDEVWVPSNFVRDGFIRSGIPSEQVFVVPNGVSDVFLRGGHTTFPLQTTKRFKFLFVGGTIERKGFDLLLRAYGQTFSDTDDVCLVVKDMGVGTFYQGQTADQLIERFRQGPHAAAIEYVKDDLTAEQMASLYATCDCLVHPYRGEGFGLPIAEAMASGIPVIVTGYGAALDFCRGDHAYLIPSSVAVFPEKRVGNIETVDHPWWAEPDQDVLRYRLRYVFEHPDEARAKGQRAQEFIRSRFTWDHTVAIAEGRLQEVRQRPVRRLQQKYRPAPAPMHVGASTTRPKVSLTMIVKNEEANLGACLQTVADLVEEIIIVDTGSTDATKEIATRFGAKVFDFPWIDDFAAARNQTLQHATGEWVFWVDADDRLDEENRNKLRDLFRQLPNENLGYVMKCLCLPDEETGTATIVDHVRMFRNHPQIRWTFRIHEQILPSIRALGGQVRWADVVINHTGYQKTGVRQGKQERDLRILTLAYQDEPDNPFTLFNLAQVYQEQGKLAESLDYFQRSLQRSAPEDSIVRKLYARIAACHHQLGQKQEALKSIEEAYRYYPDDPEIRSQEALVRADLGDRPAAIRILQQILSQREGNHFASIDVGLLGYKTRNNLAVYLQAEGRLDEADEQWQLALSERPNFLPALGGLAEISLSRGNWTTFDQHLARMRQIGRCELEILSLSARKYLARREFPQATELIHQAIALSPKAVWPRVVLSHILLQEGKDWNAAEKALRDVLVLDPNHAETLQNLKVLLSQQAKS